MHDALDGELDRSLLTPEERDTLVEEEARINAVIEAIPFAPLPDLRDAVLQRVRVSESPRVRVEGRPSLARWLWRPRRVTVGWRPVYGLAAAAIVALVAISTFQRAAPPAVATQVLTQFVLSAPEAGRVSLAGDFTDWQPTVTMTRAEPGVWTVVVPLAPGIHQYSFVVDGERWTPDPNAPAVNDGFGGVNSRVAVLTPDARKL